MIISIQQPEHLPWLGFFDKMNKCNIYVLLDNVQFKKRYFENRNKVRTKNGWNWITVPVSLKNNNLRYINNIKINNSGNWRRKYLGTIKSNYGRSNFYKKYESEFKNIINKEWKMLIDLNLELINWVRKILNIKTKMIFASQMNITESKGSDLILNICKKLNTKTYISGPDGRNYLKLEKFNEEKIKVIYHDFIHPTYQQLYSPFISHMSIIDLIFNNDGKL